MAVFLKDGDAKSVKSVNKSGILISDELMNPLTHLAGRFVGKSDTQNIRRQDSDFKNQKCEPVREGTSLTGSRTCDDSDKPLCGCYSVLLR